jgi:DnaJ family protein C protein 7
MLISIIGSLTNPPDMATTATMRNNSVVSDEKLSTKNGKCVKNDGDGEPNDYDEDMDVDHDDNKVIAALKKEEGNKLYSAQNYTKAVELYTESIFLDPKCPAYYGNRAAAYMMKKEYNKALDDARTANSLDPSFTKGYIRAAKCYIATGQTNNAMQALHQAKEIEPKNKAILDELKKVHVMMDLEEQSAKAYEKSDFRKVQYCTRCLLEYAPDCLSYKSLSAESMALTQNFSEAQILVNEILRKDQHNLEALYVRGICLYYQDQTDKAMNLFQQLLRTAPDFQKAKEIYKKAKSLENQKQAGNDAFRNNDFQKASELYTEALNIDTLNKLTNSKLYCNRALVNSKLKKYDDCITDCTKALDLDPTYIKAYLRRAKCYMDTEQYEEAVRDYEKLTKMDRNQEYRQLLKQAKLELKKSKRKDYYKILNVAKDATEEEIKKAYRKEALKHHPDRHAEADDATKAEEEVKFKEVGEAYSILSDKQKKHRYDTGQDLEEGMSMGDFDPNVIFQSFFGGGGGNSFHFSSGGGRGGGGHGHGGGGHGHGGGGFPGGFSFSFG